MEHFENSQCWLNTSNFFFSLSEDEADADHSEVISTKCPKVPGQVSVYTLVSPSPDGLHRFVLEHEASDQVETYIWKLVKGEWPAPAPSFAFLWYLPALRTDRGLKKVFLIRCLSILPGVRTPNFIPISAPLQFLIALISSPRSLKAPSPGHGGLLHPLRSRP